PTPPAPTPTSLLSLPDALPISDHVDRGVVAVEERGGRHEAQRRPRCGKLAPRARSATLETGVHLSLAFPETGGTATRPVARLFTDRKSTRLNSSHGSISYAVFC